jgi:hypothetical protein
MGISRQIADEGPYFADRELSEREMSREASDDRAAAAHAEMAERYEALATVFGAKRLTELPVDYFDPATGDEPNR